MANERAFLTRNTGTEQSPIWERWFAKTVYDAVMMSDADGETKNIKDYVDEQITTLIGGAPETADTLKELFDLISSNSTVMDALNAAIANKADKDHTHADATQETAGFMSVSDKTKLDGIEAGANKYAHPTYEAKESGLYKVTVDETGHVSGAVAVTKEDITGLGIEDTDTTYTLEHDSESMNETGEGFTKNTTTHTLTFAGSDSETPTEVTIETVSVEYEKARWDMDAKKFVGGLISATDYERLYAMEDNANNYIHPDSAGNKHIPAGGSEGQLLGWAADGTAQWIDDVAYDEATTAEAGLMSAADKTKLDGIEEGANNYVHPDTHAATMITEDETHRFVTDAEKTAWNNKASLYMGTESELPTTAPVGSIGIVITS